MGYGDAPGGTLECERRLDGIAINGYAGWVLEHAAAIVAKQQEIVGGEANQVGVLVKRTRKLPGTKIHPDNLPATCLNYGTQSVVLVLDLVEVGIFYKEFISERTLFVLFLIYIIII